MVGQEESEQYERKSSLSSWQEIVQTVASFATLRGGFIEVGVSRVGEVTGVQVGKSTIEDLSNNIKVNTDPAQYPSIQEKESEDKTVIEIHVAESLEKPVYAFGVPYKRVGRTNQKLSSSEVRRLIELHSPIAWDERPCPEAELSDLSPERIHAFVNQMRQDFHLDIEPGHPTQHILSNLRLMTRDEQLTNAAILLFGSHPQSIFPQAEVRCARFVGEDVEEYIDMQVLYGDLFAQIEESLDFVRRHIPRSARITEQSATRQETWLYPLPAVREGIINAICHRDYESPANVQVRIFDTRLEVLNPGGLPDGLTVEALRTVHSSIPRNLSIAHCLYRAGYIEQWGTGTIRMISACRQARLPAPEFEDQEVSFLVRLHSPRYAHEDLAKLGLNERQEAAIEYVRTHGSITNREYRELTGVEVVPASNELRKLMELRFLVREGGGRSTRYVLPGYTKDQLDPD